jgi:hypothetical protein
MTDRPRTSHVRVFGKSMFTLSAGWFAAIAWLWIAEIQQHVLRHGEPPAEYGQATVTGGILPAVLLGLTGFAIGRATGRAPDPRLERSEWWQAFWWSVVPNALLLSAAWVMIQEAR